MIHGGLPTFLAVVCAEIMGPEVALSSGLLLSSHSFSVSSSFLFTIALISLWSLVRLVLVVVLRLVLRFLLVGSLVVGLIRGWGRVTVRSGGRLLVGSRCGCEYWVRLVLISRMLLSWMRSAVQMILQVGYLRGKVLEHVLYVGIFCVAWASYSICWFI